GPGPVGRRPRRDGGPDRGQAGMVRPRRPDSRRGRPREGRREGEAPAGVPSASRWPVGLRGPPPGTRARRRRPLPGRVQLQGRRGQVHRGGEPGLRAVLARRPGGTVGRRRPRPVAPAARQAGRSGRAEVRQARREDGRADRARRRQAHVAGLRLAGLRRARLAPRRGGRRAPRPPWPAGSCRSSCGGPTGATSTSSSWTCPPGTGDVQLEVCQSLSLSGAVAVSTPSSLAWADVEKGVSMFDEMGVRTVALVENMSYFVCEGGGRHYPFGRPRGRDGEVGREDGGEEEGASPSARRLFPDESRVFRLPISTTLNECNDSGTPLCSQGVADGDDGGDAVAGEERRVFAELAEAVATDLVLIQHGRQAGTTSGDGSKTASAVRLEEAGDLEFDVPFTQLAVDNESESFTVRLFSGEGGYQKTVPGAELRRRDPRTGDVDDGLARSDAPRSGCGGGGGGGGGGATKRPMVEVHRGGDAPTSGARLFPASVTKKGNYGYEVEWADGATYIYSLWALARTAGAVRANGDDQSI
ncbi:hypothetical protein THAOC_21447, partial [Thalassiosira oceanica]